MVMRSAGDPQSLLQPVEGVISELDPGLPLLQTNTMEDARSGSLARERVLATLLLAFAAVGGVLSIVGV